LKDAVDALRRMSKPPKADGRKLIEVPLPTSRPARISHSLAESLRFPASSHVAVQAVEAEVVDEQ
jgi:hypothetical protein